MGSSDKNKNKKDQSKTKSKNSNKNVSKQVKGGKSGTTSKKTSKTVTPDESDEERVDFTLTTSSDSVLNIPVFTPQFLQHNKARENEMRQLRKQYTDLEEQNAELTLHNEHMKSAINELTTDTNQQKETNDKLETHLQSLRQLMSQSFKGVNVAGYKNITSDNIDDVAASLLAIVKENSVQQQPIINQAKSIVANLDYSSIT